MTQPACELAVGTARGSAPQGLAQHGNGVIETAPGAKRDKAGREPWQCPHMGKRLFPRLS